MGRAALASPTLLHCLAGILVPDQGVVWFGGQRLDTLSDERRSALRRDRFGFVFQSGQLVPELTAEQNVALPLLLSGTRRGPAMTAARKWFGVLGLDGLEGRRSGELSGGQAQRVALARGLVAGPEVLFADEPTGSLDSVSGELVMDLLTAGAREHGTTVVLVTHDARVAAYADREVVVRDGRSARSPGPGRDRARDCGWRSAAARGDHPAGRPGCRGRHRVGLLLTAVAATNAVTTWNNRHAWFSTGSAWVPAGPAAGVAPLWWHPGGDIFDGQPINRFDVAATTPRRPCRRASPVTRDLVSTTPSPALAALLRSTPANQLAGRYPGRLVGTIGDAALPSPKSLVIIVGRTAAQLAHTPNSVQVTSISTTVLGWPLPRTKVTPGPDLFPAQPGRRGEHRRPHSCPSWRWPSWSRC